MPRKIEPGYSSQLYAVKTALHARMKKRAAKDGHDLTEAVNAALTAYLATKPPVKRKTTKGGKPNTANNGKKK